MPIMNRILGALRGAANPGRGAPGRPTPGVTPGGHGGAARSGRGLLSSLLSRRGRPRI